VLVGNLVVMGFIFSINTLYAADPAVHTMVAVFRAL
jgi:hypothetical protein